MTARPPSGRRSPRAQPARAAASRRRRSGYTPSPTTSCSRRSRVSPRRSSRCSSPRSPSSRPTRSERAPRGSAATGSSPRSPSRPSSASRSSRPASWPRGRPSSPSSRRSSLARRRPRCSRSRAASAPSSRSRRRWARSRTGRASRSCTRESLRGSGSRSSSPRERFSTSRFSSGASPTSSPRSGLSSAAGAVEWLVWGETDCCWKGILVGGKSVGGIPLGSGGAANDDVLSGEQPERDPRDDRGRGHPHRPQDGDLLQPARDRRGDLGGDRPRRGPRRDRGRARASVRRLARRDARSRAKAGGRARARGSDPRGAGRRRSDGGTARLRAPRHSTAVRGPIAREAHRHAGSDPARPGARGQCAGLASPGAVGRGERVSRAATAPAGPAPTLAGLHADFERAARGAGGAVDLRLRIAARPVCIRFAGQAAAKALRPPFAHLEAQETEPPALTLHVWDSERPAAAPPRSAEADAGAAGTGPSYYSESDGSRALHQPASDVFSVLTTEADRGWFWMPDATALPYWDYTAPFRHLLSWWLDAEGFRHVHGGAVGTAEGGVLLVGPGGSGKSTTALASLLDERLRYAGDDYVAVGSGPAPAVHSLYCSGKVHPEDLSRLRLLEQ